MKYFNIYAGLKEKGGAKLKEEEVPFEDKFLALAYAQELALKELDDPIDIIELYSNDEEYYLSTITKLDYDVKEVGEC